MPGSTATAATALAGAFAAGMALGWRMNQPMPAKPEARAVAVRQKDRSLILERKPDAKLVPPHVLPQGAKLERQIQVRVRPSAAAKVPTYGPSLPVRESPPDATPFPPVTVDLSLVRMQDTTQRVIASSPDGIVVGGLDVPVDPPPVSRDFKWTVSALAGYDLTQSRKVYGAMASRTAGPFVMQAGFVGNIAFVGAGIRF